ncbi:MAG: hypothetical protein HC884_14905 [Chloroflexaceae bacterium]|nr:hypothetical protein [Chloroflexaceae bacterium]
MEFLGVGPAELLFLLVLGLVVVGPERLPDLARSAGRLVAWLMAWQQRSPEFQTIQQIRHDMQQEMLGLRDELVRTQKQLADSVQPLQEAVPALSKDLEAATSATSSLLPRSAPDGDPGKTATVPATVPTVSRAKGPRLLHNGRTGDIPALLAKSGESGEDGNDGKEPAPHQTTPPHEGAPPEGEGLAVAQFPAEHQALLFQVQALRDEVRSLEAHLRERGYLASDWSGSPAENHREVPTS